MTGSNIFQRLCVLFVIVVLGVWSGVCLRGSRSVVFGSGGIIVVQAGQSIAQALNAASTGDTIFIKNGIYVQSLIVVNTSVSIVGESVEGTLVDGGSSALVIFEVVADDVLIENLTLQNTSLDPLAQAPGVRFYGVGGARMLNVTVRNAGCGVEIRSSNFTQVDQCRIIGCSSMGINLHEGSSNNVIVGNTIQNNSRGIVFADMSSQFNRVFHNNFQNNTIQVYSLGGVNYFDAGYPAGGNYWSDFSSVDLKSGSGQDQSGSDGIFDQGFSLDVYPLVNPITNLDIRVNEQVYLVQASTNTIATRADFVVSTKSLDLHVIPAQDRASSLRVEIPKNLLSCADSADWIVTFQGNSSTPLQYLGIAGAENTYLYFKYNGMEEGEIQITGTTLFPELSPLALTAILVVFALFLSILKGSHLRVESFSKPQRRNCSLGH